MQAAPTDDDALIGLLRLAGWLPVIRTPKYPSDWTFAGEPLAAFSWSVETPEAGRRQNTYRFTFEGAVFEVQVTDFEIPFDVSVREERIADTHITLLENGQVALAALSHKKSDEAGIDFVLHPIRLTARQDSAGWIGLLGAVERHLEGEALEALRKATL
jgi:hypothetical protein